MEDSRQSASQPRCSFSFSLARCVVCALSRVDVALVSVCFSGDCFSSLFACDHRSPDASAWNSLDESLLESLGRLPHQHCADRALVCVSSASGMVDVRRNCAFTVPATGLSQEIT